MIPTRRSFIHRSSDTRAPGITSSMNCARSARLISLHHCSGVGRVMPAVYAGPGVYGGHDYPLWTIRLRHLGQPATSPRSDRPPDSDEYESRTDTWMPPATDSTTR